MTCLLDNCDGKNLLWMVIFGYKRNTFMWIICIIVSSIDEINNVVPDEWVYGPDQQEEHFKNLL